MLILTRRQSESLHIGDDIIITVVQVGRNQVRIGIDAPKHINVRRSELPEPSKKEG